MLESVNLIFGRELNASNFLVTTASSPVAHDRTFWRYFSGELRQSQRPRRREREMMAKKCPKKKAMRVQSCYSVYLNLVADRCPSRARDHHALFACLRDLAFTVSAPCSAWESRGGGGRFNCHYFVFSESGGTGQYMHRTGENASSSCLQEGKRALRGKILVFWIVILYSWHRPLQ